MKRAKFQIGDKVWHKLKDIEETWVTGVFLTVSNTYHYTTAYMYNGNRAGRDHEVWLNGDLLFTSKEELEKAYPPKEASK